jgi:exodeoxyribonuclease VII large subunit
MKLETSPTTPAPVRQIASLIASYIDRLGAIWVEGQVAQLSRRPGMHTVFVTLRDSVADVSLNITASRTIVDSLNPPLVEGASVVVYAKPRFYANRGSLTLDAREIRMVGLGELLAQLERRRQLLAAEGLFAAAHKQALPFLPREIGLVTAPQSAAERDVQENTARRWPAAQIRPRYAAMQGARAVSEMIEALQRLDVDPLIDVIVIARGGGSVEDLLPFSDEGLIRTVFAMRTPVVSAIGHEPDCPLLDLVADARASTPTDAAKLVVPDFAHESQHLKSVRHRLYTLVRGQLDRAQTSLNELCSRPCLAGPEWLINTREVELHSQTERGRRVMAHNIDRAHIDLAHQLARIRALSPSATLARGYAVVHDAMGGLITAIEQVPSKAQLVITVSDGTISATSQSTKAVAQTRSNTQQPPAVKPAPAKSAAKEQQ